MTKEQEAMKLIKDFIHELKLYEVGSIEKGKELFNAVDILEQAIDRLELVEKAFDIYIRDHRFPPYDEENIKATKLNYLNKAKKELENDE